MLDPESKASYDKVQEMKTEYASLWPSLQFMTVAHKGLDMKMFDCKYGFLPDYLHLATEEDLHLLKNASGDP